MQKIINLDGVNAPIIISRRKGTRSLRISLRSDGRIRVSVPYGVPEFAAKQFVKQKSDWINQHLKPEISMRNGDRVGKNHVLRIIRQDIERLRTRVTPNEILVYIPTETDSSDVEVQAKIIKAAEKALKKQAETLLPQRVEALARKHGIEYKDVTVKKLKSRWGACSSRKELSFNIFLMQLSWDLIDYVILHELAHTNHQHHQKSFWNEVENICPDYKTRRKELKSHPVSVQATKL